MGLQTNALPFFTTRHASLPCWVPDVAGGGVVWHIMQHPHSKSERSCPHQRLDVLHRAMVVVRPYGCSLPSLESNLNQASGLMSWLLKGNEEASTTHVRAPACLVRSMLNRLGITPS